MSLFGPVPNLTSSGLMSDAEKTETTASAKGGRFPAVENPIPNEISPFGPGILEHFNKNCSHNMAGVVGFGHANDVT
jgi:hypothetical protein